jgi:hypothetical protein
MKEWGKEVLLFLIRRGCMKKWEKKYYCSGSGLNPYSVGQWSGSYNQGAQIDRGFFSGFEVFQGGLRRNYETYRTAF